MRLKLLAQFFIFAMIGVLVPIGLYVAAFEYQLGSPMDQAVTRVGFQVFEQVIVKNYLAKKAMHPKMLIVSGSNSMFGISAAQISKATGIHTINMAVHAGLDASYLLYQIRSVAKSGDVVLLALEYPYYYRKRYSQWFIDYVAVHDPGFYYSLPFPKRLQLALTDRLDRLEYGFKLRAAGGRSKYLATDYRDGVIEKMKKIWAEDRHFDCVYCVEQMNRFGDETANRMDNQYGFQRTREQLIPLNIRPFAGHVPLWDELAYLSRWARERNVQLVATWPVMLYDINMRSRVAKDFFTRVKQHYRQLGIPMLGEPFDTTYGEENFFNTRSHLNSTARSERTSELIERMKPLLERPKGGSEY